DEEKSAIEAAIKEVEEALKGNDKDAIEAASKTLSEASATLAQKLYAEQAAQAQPGAEGEGAQEAPADDAVDAEFEEVKDDDKK
ncbi:MAG: molecular chaperone DnaK, partial [bacterium]